MRALPSQPHQRHVSGRLLRGLLGRRVAARASAHVVRARSPRPEAALEARPVFKVLLEHDGRREDESVSGTSLLVRVLGHQPAAFLHQPDVQEALVILVSVQGNQRPRSRASPTDAASATTGAAATTVAGGLLASRC